MKLINHYTNNCKHVCTFKRVYFFQSFTPFKSKRNSRHPLVTHPCLTLAGKGARRRGGGWGVRWFSLSGQSKENLSSSSPPPTPSLPLPSCYLSNWQYNEMKEWGGGGEKGAWFQFVFTKVKDLLNSFARYYKMKHDNKISMLEV